MPPFVGRKREAAEPPVFPPATPAKKAKVEEVLDAPPKDAPSLRKLREFSLGEEDSDSSLSDVGSEDLEHVPRAARAAFETEQDDVGDENLDWEDAMKDDGTGHAPLTMAGGNLELTFSKSQPTDYSALATASGAKKGPSKRERQARMLTHRMHVQFLLYHNAIRNRWICDKTVQDILVKQLPLGVKKEVEKWRVASGFQAEPREQELPSDAKYKRRRRPHKEDGRSPRDWSKSSQRLQYGKPDLSHGDPLISLMKVLSAYWKKRFYINAPGLRKHGYRTKIALQREVASFRNDEHDPEQHGERIRNIEEFRELARKCEGSRDVGAQLFTALLRGLSIESRLVANLQPSGFGWTKAEQALPLKPTTSTTEDTSSVESDESGELAISATARRPKTSRVSSKTTIKMTAKRSSKTKGAKDLPIDLDTTTEGDEVSEDDSVVDVTPLKPSRGPVKYDKDLLFPIYWTEAISPITHTVLPVSPLVLKNNVANTPEVLSTFEPRGAKAEKAKQVIAYVIAYSADGSAKDVTTRYLKRRMWPGKTKGFRLPPERMPIYNKSGKVKRYEDYDWFKRAMSGYLRSDQMKTTVDDVEESSGLVPQQPERKEAKEEGDTLQSLKASADFVLKKFLRREQALRPNAEPVRMFVSGKGDNPKEEPVYSRADVERCLSAESWHKEGRRPKLGETPLKSVPVRAVTLTRKRDVEEELRITGRKPEQGLYSWDQTEYIIPPPIQNGIIPKNAYGNIDCFVPSMVPKGAVHIPLRGTVRICKKLEIDFAEAVTGFEFGNKRAVPVITGVVVAKEHETAVRDAWEIYAEEQRVKEEGKQEKAILDLWRKMLMGLRINERVQDVYGEEAGYVDASHGMSRPAKNRKAQENYEDCPTPDGDESGGFLLPHEDDETNATTSDLIMEHHDHVTSERQGQVVQYPTPDSLPLAKAKKSRPRRSIIQDSSGSSGLSEVPSTPEGFDLDEDVKINVAAKQPPHITKPKARRGGKSLLADVDASDVDEYVTREQEEGAAQQTLHVNVPKPKPELRVGKKSLLVEADSNATIDDDSQNPQSEGCQPSSKWSRGRPRKKDAASTMSTPTRRKLRKDSTLVASPYFSGHAGS